MAKHLIPRNSYDRSSGLVDTPLLIGEIYLDVNGFPGTNPGKIIIGDGTSTYNDFNSSTYKPFITDPSIYVPTFFNSTYASTAANSFENSIYIAEQYIDYMGDGSGSTASQININQLFGNIKGVLCNHDDALNAFHKEAYVNNQDIIPERYGYNIGSTATPFYNAYINNLISTNIEYKDDSTSFVFNRGDYIDAYKIFDNSTTFNMQLRDLINFTISKSTNNYLDDRTIEINPEDIISYPRWIDSDNSSVSYNGLKNTLNGLYDVSLKQFELYINESISVAPNTSTYVNVYITSSSTFPFDQANICSLYFRETNLNETAIISPVKINTNYTNSATLSFKIYNFDPDYNLNSINGNLSIIYN